MGSVFEVIKERSSTRGYTEEKLSDAELNAVIEAGLHAPTATNRQELHFTVVSGDNPVLTEIEAEKNLLRNLDK